MTTRHHITTTDFTESIPGLVLGRELLPKNRRDLHVLLLSTVLRLVSGKRYAEREINAVLKSWLAGVGKGLTTDHVAIRRHLVDEGLLERNASGTRYSLMEESPFFSFDEAIKRVNVAALMRNARAEREAQKQAYLARREQQEPRKSDP